jgi:hypothetical protein
VYELERDGRTVYVSSFGVVSELLSMGWSLRAQGHLSELMRERAIDAPPRRPRPLPPDDGRER